jgi:hypothetical protein
MDPNNVRGSVAPSPNPHLSVLVGILSDSALPFQVANDAGLATRSVKACGD